MTNVFTRRNVIGAAVTTLVSAACASSACAQSQDAAYHVRDFGARGDGATDDTQAIQRAIDAAARGGGGIVHLGRGTFQISLTPAIDGGGVEGLRMRSGVALEAGGGVERAASVLRLADGQRGPGTFARMISSGKRLRRVTLRGFTVDGNRAGQGAFQDDTNGGAILLGWHSHLDDVRVENMHVHDANGQGIMLLGSPDDLSRGLVITDNLVERVSMIGIQSSQFDGLRIEGNVVRECGDNGIDIYGNNDTTRSPVATSRNGLVSRNTISGALVGVFLETVADCRAVENTISGCRRAGFAVNRIHGEPRNLEIADNRVSDTPIGFAISGDTGGVAIRNNTVSGFSKAGIELSYNVSRVIATGNTFVPQDATTAIVLSQPQVIQGQPPNRLVWNRITDNVVPRDHRADRLFVNRHETQIDNIVGRFNRIEPR